MKYKWNNLPKTDNIMIKYIRNFCIEEFDGTQLYPTLPSFQGQDEGSIGQWIKENVSEKDQEEFWTIYAEEASLYFPLASTFHNYSRKHDSEWRATNLDRNHNLLKNLND